MSLAGVRALLASTIAAHVEMDPPLVVLAYVPDAPTVPCAWVRPVTVAYADSFGGCVVTSATFTITVLVSRADDRSSQELLDDVIDQVADALTRTAPGGQSFDLASEVTVANYGWHKTLDGAHLGADLTLTIADPG